MAWIAFVTVVAVVVVVVVVVAVVVVVVVVVVGGYDAFVGALVYVTRCPFLFLSFFLGFVVHS